MEVGLSLMSVRPQLMPELAARAEELGYESVFAPDHLLFPVHFSSRYPGSPDGEFPYPRDMPLYDPWLALMDVARATKTIRLGTAIYVLALRHPMVAARLITTLDVLSGGRVLVGVGSGWLAEEFKALGIEPRTRFRRTEEAAQIMRLLWTDKETEYHGEHFDFGPVYFEPKPATKPHPPILFGGYSDAALRRAVRFGDGWLSGGGAEGIEAIAALMQRVEELRDEYGITRPFQVTILEGRPEPSFLKGMADLGVHRVVVMPWTRSRDAFTGMEAYAEEARSVLR